MMALEDVVPRRSDIRKWLEEIDEAEAKSKKKPVLDKRSKQALPPQAKAQMKANYRAAVHTKLQERFPNLSEDVYTKIESDLDSYMPELSPKRSSREV